MRYDNLLNFREYIEQDIVQFAKENPHVALYLKPRRHRSPVVVAEYCKYIYRSYHFNFIITVK